MGLVHRGDGADAGSAGCGDPAGGGAGRIRRLAEPGGGQPPPLAGGGRGHRGGANSRPPHPVPVGGGDHRGPGPAGNHPAEPAVHGPRLCRRRLAASGRPGGGAGRAGRRRPRTFGRTVGQAGAGGNGKRRSDRPAGPHRLPDPRAPRRPGAGHRWGGTADAGSGKAGGPGAGLAVGRAGGQSRRRIGPAGAHHRRREHGAGVGQTGAIGLVGRHGGRRAGTGLTADSPRFGCPVAPGFGANGDHRLAHPALPRRYPPGRAR